MGNSKSKKSKYGAPRTPGRGGATTYESPHHGGRGLFGPAGNITAHERGRIQLAGGREYTREAAMRLPASSPRRRGPSPPQIMRTSPSRSPASRFSAGHDSSRLQVPKTKKKKKAKRK